MATTMLKPRVAAGSGVPTKRLSSIDRWARALLASRLAGLRKGRLVVRDADGEHVFGDANGTFDVQIDVVRSRFYRRVLTGGTLALGAAYIDADWECDDLAGLFRLFIVGSPGAGADLERGPAHFYRLAAQLWHRLRPNTRRGSRRNIRDHYDLGNDLFAQFLDASMTYSAAVFEHPGATLEEAQEAKLERICRKLDLRPEHHVLEIGTGWGSFAIHAARHYGCRVTTTTISAEQHRLATERVAAAGLADRIRVLHEDYRDLEGEYDRLVSIEMIEAVGHEHLGTFFRTCRNRLRRDGRMLLQVITSGDHYYDAYRRSVDFIQRYIFPGGLCPAPMALAAAIGRHSDLRMTHIEDLTADYAETLRHWRARFANQAGTVLTLGYPERFLRLWDYYLQYCEAGFAECHIGTLQIVLDRPDSRTNAIRPLLTGPSN